MVRSGKVDYDGCSMKIVLCGETAMLEIPSVREVMVNACVMRASRL